MKALTYVEIDIPSFSEEGGGDNSTALLHMDGTDATTLFPDSSGNGHDFTAIGNAQVDTAQSKFGGAAALLDGTGDYLRGDGSSDFAFGTGAFTIDLWFRQSQSTGTSGDSHMLYDSRDGISTVLLTIYVSSGSNVLIVFTNSGDVITGTTATAINTWYHVALTRSGTSMRLFLNGTQEGSTYVAADNFVNPAQRPVLGIRGSTLNTGGFPGWIDELRVIKGTAAWTSNFTPETEAYGGESEFVETTFRFAVDTDYLPDDIDAIPSIKDVAFRPSIISLGENLGQRSSVTVKFKDHRHIFAAEAYSSGTFWGKFRARYGLKLRNRPLRLITGLLGQPIASMETRHFFIESTEGPSVEGEFQIIAKDIIKAADDDRALAPSPSPGFVTTDITDTASRLTLSPAGIGNSDYEEQGYAAIGGSEIVQFHRDALTASLLHFDSADNSVVVTDSAVLGRQFTLAGNTHIDTAQSQFGGSSMRIDGSGDWLDYLDSETDLAFGSGDFTIEFWVRPASGGTFTWFEGRAAVASSVTPRIHTITAALRYHVNGVDQISGGTLTTDAWQHVAVSRSGTNTRMFLNGTQVGSTYVDTNNYIMGTDRPRIGAAADGTADPEAWIDEVRISLSARYTANFTPSASAFALGPFTGDVLVLTQRAQFNTPASSHSAQDRVQNILQYTSEDPANILEDLWLTYAGVDPSYINVTNWLTETQTYLGSLYTAVIAEPTAISKLISELIQQAALVHWWDDKNQQIKLQVLRAISTSADDYTQDNYLEDSLEYREQPEKRISQVITYFGKIDPLGQDDADNYRSAAHTIDEEAEVEYESPAIKRIFSRWIPEGGRSIAERLNDIQIARYRDPPRRLNFSVMRYVGDDPELGQGYNLEGQPFQDITGAAVSVPIQITSLNPGAAIIELEAQEALFQSLGADSPDSRTLRIDLNSLNYNMRSAHDTIYTAPVSGITVTCIIDEGVSVGSSSTALPAFHVGDWPAGVTLILRVRGRVQGAGGRGGRNGTDTAQADGQAGGTALYTRETITVDVTAGDGEIWSGGGGGGGTENETTGGSGGGGAGRLPGDGGILEDGNGAAGQPGTTEAGGAGGDGSAQNGGNGGGPGLAGSASTGADPGAGGAAGAAVDGVSFVTYSGTGDRRGGEIN